MALPDHFGSPVCGMCLREARVPLSPVLWRGPHCCEWSLDESPTPPCAVSLCDTCARYVQFRGIRVVLCPTHLMRYN